MTGTSRFLIGRDRMARALGATRVGEVRRLEGGIACAVERVELIGGEPTAVVVKRFPPDSTTSPFEWDALRFAARQTAVPSPEPLAFDADGAWFGTPAIAMSCLPGRPVLTPDDGAVGRWTEGLAAALAAIHRTPVPEATDSAFLDRPAIWHRWTPEGLSHPRREAIATAIVHLREATWERGFCHGDFHPGNVLFEHGKVSGVVDWISSRRAPLLSDVGRCRAALALWPGGDAPDLFRAHYAALTRRPLDGLDGLADWDLLSGAILLQHDAQQIAYLRQIGAPMTRDLVVERATTFVDRALNRR